MAKLGQDCLEMIFCYLSGRDLINAARVCKFWRRVSGRMIKELDFANFFRVTADSKLTLRIMEEILWCCGEYVTDVKLPFERIAHPPNTLDIVSSYCPNLRNLWLSDTYVPESGMDSLTRRCPKLQWLSFDNIGGRFDFELTQLLRKCRSIVGLKLTKIDWFTGRSLCYLQSKNFNALEVTSCQMFDLSYLTGAKVLNKQLKHFTFRDGRDHLSDLSALSLMTNLTHLEIDWYCLEMDDEWMIQISRQCSLLEKLVLVIGQLVTGSGLDAVLELPMLEKLEIMDAQGIDRGIWGQKTIRLSMKSLYLLNFQLMNLEIFSLIRMAPELADLILEDCHLPERDELHAVLGRNLWERRNDIEFLPLKLLVQKSGGGSNSQDIFDEEYLIELEEDMD